MPGDKIAFNRPYAIGTEYRYISEAIAAAHLSGDGPFTKRANRWLAERTGVAGALLTHSCTAALEMMALLLDIEPGDEIIMPSYTFVSTANAFVLRGGIPVFVDIREDTLNIDETLVEAAITPRTRAIVAVHYAGVGCEMDALRAIAAKHGIALLEDAAQALGATYKRQQLGSFGALSAVSFHETKNVISGEGGALLIADATLAERAEILREKGTNRSNFLRGVVDKYTWVDVGSSYLPSEIVAAFLWGQLEEFDELLRRRLEIWNAYHERLEPLERAGALRRPIVPAECGHNGHLYYILAPSPRERERALAQLRSAGIDAIFHYVPLHSSPAGHRFARTSRTLERTDDLSARLIRLPLHYALTETQIDTVCRAIEAVFAPSVF